MLFGQCFRRDNSMLRISYSAALRSVAYGSSNNNCICDHRTSECASRQRVCAVDFVCIFEGCLQTRTGTSYQSNIDDVFGPTKDVLNSFQKTHYTSIFISPLSASIYLITISIIVVVVRHNLQKRLQNG